MFFCLRLFFSQFTRMYVLSSFTVYHENACEKYLCDFDNSKHKHFFEQMHNILTLPQNTFHMIITIQSKMVVAYFFLFFAFVLYFIAIVEDIFFPCICSYSNGILIIWTAIFCFSYVFIEMLTLKICNDLSGLIQYKIVMRSKFINLKSFEISNLTLRKAFKNVHILVIHLC